MPQTYQPNNSQQSKQKVFFRGGFWWISLGAAILIGIVIRLSRVFATQAEQYTFIAQAVVNVLIFAAILVQALIYRRQWQVMEGQWDAMQHGLRQTDKVIEKMQGQLETIDKQAEIMIKQKEVMEKQLNVMVSQANLFIESLEETRKVWMQNERMVEAMQGQLAAMNTQAAASETQSKAAELSAQAAQHSVDVMRESYIATTRAYIGIRQITVGALVVGQIPTVTVIWHNGGNTPAFRFRANVYLAFGDKPDTRGYFIDDDWSESRASFVPPGVSNPVEYPQVETGFKPVTKEMLDALNGGSKRLYAMIDALYLDFTESRRFFDSSYIFNPCEGTFTELYEYTAQKQG